MARYLSKCPGGCPPCGDLSLSCGDAISLVLGFYSSPWSAVSIGTWPVTGTVSAFGTCGETEEGPVPLNLLTVDPMVVTLSSFGELAGGNACEPGAGCEVLGLVVCECGHQWNSACELPTADDVSCIECQATEDGLSLDIYIGSIRVLSSPGAGYAARAYSLPGGRYLVVLVDASSLALTAYVVAPP